MLASVVALIQSRARILSGEVNDVEEDGNEPDKPDRPWREHDAETCQNLLLKEQVDTKHSNPADQPLIAARETDNSEVEEEDDTADKGEDQIDDGMVLGGWSAPGRL